MVPPKSDLLVASMATTSPSAADDTVPGAGSSEESVERPSTDYQRMQQLLITAAEAAEGAEVPLEEFMRSAWSAFVDARPGLRDHLADAQLLQQIQELRAQGRVGQA